MTSGKTNPTRFRLEEWHVRRQVMDACLEILSDGQPHTSRSILEQLEKRGFAIPKRLVNSVLFSEAKRYVTYDRRAFSYQLRNLDDDQIDATFLPEAVPNQVSNCTKEVRARFIGRNDMYVFTTSNLTGPAFFDVAPKGRTIEVVLNKLHPIFGELSVILDSTSEFDCEGARQRIIELRHTVEMLIAAWSRYETDQPDGPRKFRAEEARLEWGRNARAFVIESIDSDS